MTVEMRVVERDVKRYIRMLRRIDPQGTDWQYARLQEHLIALVAEMCGCK